MMRIKQAIENKLNSTSGATLMIALLVFIILATIGSVVLAFASSSSGAMDAMIQKDMQTRSVMDASNLVCKYMESEKCEVELYLDETTNKYKKTSKVEETFIKKLNDSVVKMKNKESNKETIGIEVKAPKGSRNEPKFNVEEVIGKMTLTQNENPNILDPIQVTIEFEGEDNHAKTHATMMGYVKEDVRVIEDQANGTYQNNTYYIIYFSNPVIEIGGSK